MSVRARSGGTFVVSRYSLSASCGDMPSTGVVPSRVRRSRVTSRTMGATKCAADSAAAHLALTQLRLHLLRHGDTQSHDGVRHVAALYGAERGLRGVFAGAHPDLDGEESTGVDGSEAEVDEAASGGRGRIELDDTEPLLVVLLAEVDALEAAGVDDVGVLGENLVPVDVAQRDVVQAAPGRARSA